MRLPNRSLFLTMLLCAACDSTGPQDGSPAQESPQTAKPVEANPGVHVPAAPPPPDVPVGSPSGLGAPEPQTGQNGDRPSAHKPIARLGDQKATAETANPGSEQSGRASLAGKRYWWDSLKSASSYELHFCEDGRVVELWDGIRSAGTFEQEDAQVRLKLKNEKSSKRSELTYAISDDGTLSTKLRTLLPRGESDCVLARRTKP